MIEFNCRQCEKELKVDDSKAGLRGKCPRCSSIIIVPEASVSGNEPIFVENDDFFSGSDLNKFYKQFFRNFEKYIYGHCISNEKWGDCARFELSTGNRRSQLVWLLNFTNKDNESNVGIFSFVGKITLMESAVRALQSVDSFAPYAGLFHSKDGLECV